MKRYTESEIKEFKKMGYNINPDGSLGEATRLQKTLKVKDSLNSFQQNSMNMVLSSSKTKSYKSSSRKVTNQSTHFIRTISDSDIQRQALGLSITRNPDLDYYLLPDGSKVCRCCQQRKMANEFYNSEFTTDRKESVCIADRLLATRTLRDNKKEVQ